MTNKFKKLFIFLQFTISISILFCFQSIAQKPVARFLADSVNLGEAIYYSVVFKHQANSDVYFPDSTYNFTPFEYIDRVYFPTKTTNGISIDSAIYRLRTFSIDSLQKLSIYVTTIQNDDSSKVQSMADSILFKTNIFENPSKLNLITDIQFTPLKIRQNFIPSIIEIALGLVALWILWSIFGKTLKKQLSIFQLNRKHRDFTRNFKKLTKSANQNNVEKVLIYWKEYLGNLHSQSYNTMTTKEIIDKLPNEGLGFALKEIDEMVYGGKSSHKINESIASLENYIANEFNILKMAITSTK